MVDFGAHMHANTFVFVCLSVCLILRVYVSSVRAGTCSLTSNICTNNIHFIHLNVCAFIHARTCMSTRTIIYIFTYRYVYVYVYEMYVCMCVCVCVCVCMYVRAQVILITFSFLLAPAPS